MSSSKGMTPEARAKRNATKYRRHKERMATDPEYRRKRLAASSRRYKERMRTDSVFRKREYKKEGLRQYGLSLAEYEQLRELQNNMCGICDREPMVGEKELAVDHNHETRYIRGLLCFHCNVGLGHFMDSVPLLCRAIQWLTERNG